MAHVMTVICNPQKPELSGTAIDEFWAALEMADARPDEVEILAEGVAADIFFELNEDETLPAIRKQCRGPFDINIQPVKGRARRLLIADMDSTIIQQECLDELAAYAGKRDEISAITARAMRGELDFEGALRERVAMLKGLSVDALEATLSEKITLMPGAMELVATMKARGAVTALVSGGFTFFTARIADLVGFDTNQGNRLVIEDGKLTGEVEEPILGKEAKLEALNALCAEHNIDADRAMAVGDGANDLAMLNAAGAGVALHAKPVVAQAARYRIDNGDLTALLYLQGIRRDQFAVE
ncbi:phosphoserine phosphatase SerB [Aquisalinus flavus]|uniref:Phosphoserine phosphatase n=1 Tax=Aquisalinus flavus TaxID=1526572 RepID=A0A8J2V1M2_9PROT|nr:phosphoserine phosphatase SerB [Aquisalinus flavus]MBD0427483.1 phosphoserine phosphatase SerB [Aquisalinus flavus]UNE47279.1 phosphoserine phosphatase SerB [Aquisalinus flavus]GGD01341.1 phosphoserine phosphatase SerB [Aquisalinus flavus]